MSSLSFATFLSSITAKDTTQSHRGVYNTVPQEQLSLKTESMQFLITSLVSQTNSRKTNAHKTTLEQAPINMYSLDLHPPTFLRSSA